MAGKWVAVNRMESLRKAIELFLRCQRQMLSTGMVISTRFPPPVMPGAGARIGKRVDGRSSCSTGLSGVLKRLDDGFRREAMPG